MIRDIQRVEPEILDLHREIEPVARAAFGRETRLNAEADPVARHDRTLPTAATDDGGQVRLRNVTREPERTRC